MNLRVPPSLVAKRAFSGFLGPCVLLALGGAGGAAEPVKPESDPLAGLNRTFRAAYAKARKEALTKKGPVLFVEGDYLTLLRDGKPTRVRVIPDLYHDLKNVSHVPLALFVMLEPYGPGEIPEDRLAELRGFREQMLRAEKTLEKRGFNEETLRRQQQIFAGSTRFLDKVLAKKRATQEELKTFARSMTPFLNANIDEAVKAQLDGIHKQARAWRAELTPNEWKRLHVVIQGSHMPRKGYVALQYFARLLGEKGEGLRIIYAESLYDEERALKLLGNYLLDVPTGIAFFDDPLRMTRDLLGDAAKAYIQKMHFD